MLMQKIAVIDIFVTGTCTWFIIVVTPLYLQIFY